jgi:hypothetical protein
MIESVGIFLIVFTLWTLGGFVLEGTRAGRRFLRWLDKAVTR